MTVAVPGYEHRHLLVGKPPLTGLAATPPWGPGKAVAPFEGLKEVGFVCFGNAVELVRLIEGCCLEEAVPPAKGCGERHIALIRRPSKRKPLFERTGHGQPPVLVAEMS
jgi:hypothetical protein